MDSRTRTAGYESWKYSEEAYLRVKYDEYIKENYNPIMPDTYVSFDDFCMGQWQWA